MGTDEERAVEDEGADEGTGEGTVNWAEDVVVVVVGAGCI